MKLKQYIDEYKKKLSLQDYRIEVVIAEEKKYISDRNSKLKPIKSDTIAEAFVQNFISKEYLIVIYKDALESDLRDTVLHELLHILFWEFTDTAESNINSIEKIDERKKILDKLRFKEHEIIQKIINVI